MTDGNGSNKLLDEKKVHAFADIVYRLAKKKFGTDEDGDPFIEVKIIDRTRCERMHYEPIPYDHKLETQEEWDWYERMLFLNLKLASDAVDRYSRHRSHERSRVQEQERRVAVAASSPLRLCSVPSCRKCSYAEREPSIDCLGFIHYGREAPTSVPKPKSRDEWFPTSHFAIDNYQIEYFAKPSKHPCPYGHMAFSNIDCAFNWKDGKLEVEKPDLIPAYVVKKLAAILANPDPKKPIREL
jgi:hypothetical protein